MHDSKKRSLKSVAVGATKAVRKQRINAINNENTQKHWKNKKHEEIKISKEKH